MAFINLYGEREGKMYNSELYKKKTIDYLSKKGHMLVGDSLNDGTLTDLTFYHPQHGKCQTRVETKYQNLSISDKQFLKEVGGHFIAYMKMHETERFYFYVFIRKCLNQRRWKKIFDERVCTKEEIEKFRQMVLETLDELEENQFNSYSVQDFYRFIMNTKVWQVTYEGLCAQVDNLSEDKFDSLAYVLDDIEPIREKEQIMGNFLKVTSFPQFIFTTNIATPTKKFYLYGNMGIYYPFRGYLFSLGRSHITHLERFLYLKSIKKKNLSNWFSSDPDSYKVVQQLIKGYVINRGLLIGAKYDYDLNKFYFYHKNKREISQKIRGRQTSKIYAKNGELQFVEHLGFSLDVRLLDNDFYVVINPVRLFTDNGKNLIKGRRSKGLHEKFPPIYDFNSTIRDHFQWFVNLLSLDRPQLDEPISFIMSSPVTFDINWKPKKELKYDVTFNTTLDDFFPKEGNNNEMEVKK